MCCQRVRGKNNGRATGLTTRNARSGAAEIRSESGKDACATCTDRTGGRTPAGSCAAAGPSSSIPASITASPMSRLHFMSATMIRCFSLWQGGSARMLPRRQHASTTVHHISEIPAWNTQQSAAIAGSLCAFAHAISSQHRPRAIIAPHSDAITVPTVHTDPHGMKNDAFCIAASQTSRLWHRRKEQLGLSVPARDGRLCADANDAGKIACKINVSNRQPPTARRGHIPRALPIRVFDRWPRTSAQQTLHPLPRPNAGGPHP